MFRGKESSNRIELSRLVQELLNFGVFSSLWLWRVGGWGWGWLGVPPTHVHIHRCTSMHGKWPPPLGKSLGIPYDVICACACVHMHASACVWGHPLTTPTHIHPPPHPQGDPQNQSKFNST